MEQDKNFVKLEIIIGLFTIEDGDIKVLLEKKKEDPYKGYWMLPNDLLENSEVLEDCAQKIITKHIGIENLFLEQSKHFSALDRNQEERIIASSFLSIIDIVTYKLKKNISEEYELNWFSIDSIPKMAYDHDEILKELIKQLKRDMSNSVFLNKIFSLEFTLPELQSVYEQINKIKVDRRNFRKKILSLNLLEDTSKYGKFEGNKPAKIYKFKDNIEEIDII